MLMIVLIIITTMIITLPQVKIKAADLLMVKALTDNLEASYREAEAKDLSIINANFKTIGFREVHINKTVKMALTSISIIHMISRQNSMAHPVVYAAVLIIPLSIATKENMT